MNPAILSAATHTALKARIEKERRWSETESYQMQSLERKAHMEGRALAFGKVLEWLKESEDK